MHILISGATGFIGTVLINHLHQAGHQITAAVHSYSPTLPSFIKQYKLTELASAELKPDAFINLAGENIAAKRWTADRKKTLYMSRVGVTLAIRNALKSPPRVVISMSAIGYYGITSKRGYRETTEPGAGFAHDLCKSWEDAVFSFSGTKTRIVIFRLGVVLGQGGALKRMRPIFNMGFGGKIGNGQQWFAWIHLHDVILAIMSALQNTAYTGIYNLVSPHSVTQEEFSRCYAKVLKRPSLFTTPAFMLNLLYGEMASLLIYGPQIIPSRLQDMAFPFQYKDLTKALEQIEK